MKVGKADKKRKDEEKRRIKAYTKLAEKQKKKEEKDKKEESKKKKALEKEKKKQSGSSVNLTTHLAGPTTPTTGSPQLTTLQRPYSHSTPQPPGNTESSSPGPAGSARIRAVTAAPKQQQPPLLPTPQQPTRNRSPSGADATKGTHSKTETSQNGTNDTDTMQHTPPIKPLPPQPRIATAGHRPQATGSTLQVCVKHMHA